MEDRPYRLFLADSITFGEHRHADIEFCYCVRGGPVSVKLDKTEVQIRENELLLIGPTVQHSYPERTYENTQIFTGIVGVSFLKAHFKAFSKSSLTYRILNLKSENPEHKKLRETLSEMIEAYPEHTEKSSMLKEANLYKVCAYLLSEIPNDENARRDVIEIENLANVEKALDLIYYDYKKPISVEEVSKITGYGKSNFCKLFKRLTGDTFHSMLNKRRITVSYGFLTQTDMSISDISCEVGYLDSKTFCRVFKEISNMSPGEYRSAYRR